MQPTSLELPAGKESTIPVSLYDITGLDSLKLLPTPANIEKYTEYMTNCEKLQEIIQELNLRDRRIQRAIGNHNSDENSCEQCGFSKCQLRYLHSTQFKIIINIKCKRSMIRESLEHRCNKLRFVTESITITEKTVKVNEFSHLIFSRSKFFRSGFSTMFDYYRYVGFLSSTDSKNQDWLKLKQAEKEGKYSSFLYRRITEDEKIILENDEVSACNELIQIDKIDYHIVSMVFEFGRFLSNKRELFELLRDIRKEL